MQQYLALVESLWAHDTRAACWAWGAVLGAVSVVTGAFGAHALKGIDPGLAKTWDTAVRYHTYSVFMLLFLAVAPVANPVALVWPLRLVLTGTTLFSGSLYLLVVTGIRKLGAITPIGGLILIAAWLALGGAIIPRPSRA